MISLLPLDENWIGHWINGLIKFLFERFQPNELLIMWCFLWWGTDCVPVCVKSLLPASQSAFPSRLLRPIITFFRNHEYPVRHVDYFLHSQFFWIVSKLKWRKLKNVPCRCPPGHMIRVNGTKKSCVYTLCATRPCHRGTCVAQSPSKFTCHCPEGYRGRHCETTLAIYREDVGLSFSSLFAICICFMALLGRWSTNWDAYRC